MTNPAPTRRIRELDALRGVGATMVVLFHFTTMFDRFYDHPSTFTLSFDVGYYGVNLFFLVSGFVIYMTLERTKSARHFIVSRATRLFPVYWIAVLITFAAVALIGLPGKERTVWELLANLTMLHEYAGIRHIDGVYWTLSIELAFYIWMFAFFRAGLLQRPLRMFLIWLTTNILIFGTASALGITLPNVFGIALFTAYGNLFFAGIGFYIWRQTRSPAGLFLVVVTFALEAAVRTDVILLSLLIWTIFGLAATGQLRVLAIRPLIYLGAISYPLYLIHEHVGYIIIRQLYASDLNHPAIILGVPIVTALLLAAAIHHLIEEPAMHALRARL
ncbi:MAG: acyltransferase, partial [Dehalococcoidia bacterium]|nr:acyltransferase [Dehalococcoidia bacterium]